MLHSPEYRARFAADLKKMLPRIPKVAGFWALEEVVDGEVSIRPQAGPGAPGKSVRFS